MLALGRWENARDAASLVTAICLFYVVTQFYPIVAAGGRPDVVLLDMVPGLPIRLTLEPLGMIFAGIASFLWILTTLYAIGYMRGHHEENQTRFFFFFAIAIAMKTYFQKIADPGDIAPTAAVAFTINHIAAVFLPALLGYLWLVSPASVFVLAAGMATLSFMLALLIPRHPEPGNETVFARFIPAPAE